MKRKTVIIVIGSFKIGGAEKMAINVGTFLLQNGYDVYFALLRPIFELHHTIPAERIYVLNRSVKLHKYLRFIRVIVSLFLLRLRKGADVVIGFTYFSSFVSCFAFARNTIARLDTNPYRLAPKRRRVADFVFAWPLVKRVVVPSKGLYDYVATAKSRYKGKLLLIPNSFEIASIVERSKAAIPEQFPLNEKRYISAMGRITFQKKYELLILAYSKSKIKEFFNLVIIGDGNVLDDLTKLTKRLGLEEKVFFTGMLKNPFPVIAKSQFFINTSSVESFCNVILEALVLEVPVIATDCDFGPSEIIQNGSNGYLIAVNSEQAIIEILDKVNEDPNLIESVKKNASISIKRFSLDNVGNEWIKAINELTK
jgi:GalNAc-alpha-(1->4)-GalNAc-alpha-(1->3)-diNAcBac-PP-undecaprenol alpha-1,4-N-acetyl-D-galactosaminyltransferase